MTEFLLVRHGLTAENIKFVLIGRTDPPLHSLGIEQSESIGKALSAESLDVIVSSPLRRSVQTARRITARNQALVQRLPELSEIDLGIVDGLSSFSAYERYKEQMDEALDLNTQDFMFQGGEWRSNALSRFDRCLHQLAIQFSEGTVCIVTHGGLLGLWLASLHGFPLGRFRDWQPSHASLTRLHASNGHYILEAYNDTSHIPDSLKQAAADAKA